MSIALLTRLSVAASLAAACASTYAAAPSKIGGQLTIGLAQDPSVVDALRYISFVDRQFGAPVYEALFDVDTEGNTVPFLAERYTVSPDLKTWRITLRPGIRFHDGTPLDAAAVVANLDRTSNPANRCRCLGMLADFAAWKAIDPLTVEITLAAPNAALPTMLAEAPGLMVSPTAFKADPQGIGLHPVGTGPFRFVEWVRNSRYVVERNPDYWQPGKPYLDRIVLRGMQNSETRAAAFRAGQTDIILQPTMQFVATMQKDPHHVILSPAGFGSEGVYFNTTKPPLDDIRVRWAVVHAMDRELLNRTLNFGIPALAYSPFGRGMTQIKQPTDIYPEYNPEKAKALLAEYGKPVAFTLTFNNAPAQLQMMQSLQQMWAAVGIQVTLSPLDQNRLIQITTSGKFQASLYRWTGRADPDANTYNFFHSRYAAMTPSLNYGGYASPKVDALLEQGRSTADPNQRAEIYSELARVLIQEIMPHAYLNAVADTIITKPHVKGIRLIPDGVVRLADVWRE